MVVKSEKTRYSQPNAFFSGLFTRSWIWNLVQKTLLTNDACPHHHYLTSPLLSFTYKPPCKTKSKPKNINKNSICLLTLPSYHHYSFKNCHFFLIFLSWFQIIAYLSVIVHSHFSSFSISSRSILYYLSSQRS